MFDIGKWQEIFSTLKKNKLRTFLTSFSVAWGIFMLIVLLGAGNGLQNAVMENFKDDATNAIWFWGGVTKMEHKGLNTGREIKFTNSDYETIKTQIEGIDRISGQFNIWGSTQVSYKQEYGSFNIRCIFPDYRYIENSEILSGRFVNDIDIQKKRKVTTIGVDVKKALFKDEDPLGKYIKINGIPFQVVGIYTDAGGRENKRVYLPFAAAQQIFNGGVRVHAIGLTTGDASLEENQAIEQKIVNKLAAIHEFNPEDKSAIHHWNTLKEFKQTQKIFGGISMFIWFIGIGTIVAGVVGVSNIMMIVVKERTREIGVRKAIGASPASVVGLVLSEAVFITTLAGYVGLVLGTALMEGVDFMVDKAIENAPETTDAAGQAVIFLNPGADLGIAIGATVLLIICGSLAGLIPALKAARIKPIEALRYE